MGLWLWLICHADIVNSDVKLSDQWWRYTYEVGVHPLECVYGAMVGWHSIIHIHSVMNIFLIITMSQASSASWELS